MAASGAARHRVRAGAHQVRTAIYAARRRVSSADPACMPHCGHGAPSSRHRGVPAYVVLRDCAIDGIAAARPTTLNELRGIAGIGDKKLEHYGDELIALVRAADA